jgi:hypothetical protein
MKPSNETKTNDVTEEDIHRDAVIGHIVIENHTGNGHYFSVYTEPICVYDDGEENDVIIEKQQTIIGMLPALSGTYRVYGFGSDGHEIELGYEYVGAYHPNWVDKLNARRNEGQRVHIPQKED